MAAKRQRRAQVEEQFSAEARPTAAPTHPAGEWPLADLGPSQCRFACTPDSAPAHAHRFCGQPTRVGARNLYGSWCEDHIPRVWGQGTISERMATNRPRHE